MAIDKKVVKKGILEPTHVKNILAIKGKCHTKIGNLSASVIRSDEPIKFQDLDHSKFVKIIKGQKWAKKFGCAWFHFTGKVSNKGKDKHVVVRLKLHGEGLVFRPDGTVVQGVTQVLSKGDVFHATIGKQIIDIAKKSEGNEDIDFYVDAGFNGILRFQKLCAHLDRFDICIEHDEIIQYYYDYIDLFFLMMKLNEKSDRYAEISKGLKESFKLFKKEGVEAARRHIASFQYKEGDYPNTKLYSIGHAHIDLAWLWPIRETKRKVARTFGNQLRNIEKYQGFIFAESQPQMFQWLKEGYPDLYAKVKEQVKAGRIELQGANWVEGDCNLTSGESWIRQSLYGQKFWKEEFDFKSNMCWLPDVFGFPASLPQVFKKCGMDYFMTIKLISNTVNQFPHKTFFWEGIDGTKILAHMEPQGDYNSGATAFAIYKSDQRNTERDTVPIALQIYGDGDGGGGPSEGHIEFVKRHKVCKMSKAVDFFKDLEKESDVIVTYKGELYYERHQGTYTSQANSKKWNRRIEEQLHKVEWLGAYAFMKGITYDRAKVEQIWKEVLLYQFHDIIPGSSIKRVYDESIERYKVMSNELAEIEEKLISQITTEHALYTINPVDFKRIEYVKKDLIKRNISLSSSFKLFIEELWPDRLYYNSYSNKKNESVSPYDFKEKISNMNELFKGVGVNNPKDLLQFIIIRLHDELNLAHIHSNNNILNNEQTNKQLMFQIFTQDFMDTNKSIISDLFYGVNYNIIQCQGCLAQSFNYQTYFFFVFPLEEIRIYKNQNNFNQNSNNFNFNQNFMNFNNNFNMNNNNNNEINIYDCFSYEQRITYMTGDNAMHCNYCRNTCPSSMCTLLAFGPEIIIIILNRGQGIQYKVKINFFEELNLDNYIEYKNTGVMYNLIGVITHMGGSDMSGHFIAYCKNPIDNTWYQYNDSVINQVTNFKAEVIDYAMPYLLFYQKVGN